MNPSVIRMFVDGCQGYDEYYLKVTAYISQECQHISIVDLSTICQKAVN